MCFIEFVGYTCGHTSLPVLRACPLTTASHTYPTCPRRGDKAFFAGEMCSACQRIIHSRATQIEEYEHRFMHERGVCGCETVFPYLIRPRVIGSCGGGGGVEGFGYEDHEHAVELEGSGPNDASPNSVQLPPLLCEAMDDVGRAVVSVRLPSLYAAEWVADHRARHDEGLCRCNVDFRTYQVAMTEGTGDRQTTERGQQSSTSNSSIRRVSSMSAMSLDDDMAKPKWHTRSSSHEDFSFVMNESTDESVSSDEVEFDTQYSAEEVTTADEGPCRPFPPPQPGLPVRYSGAVFAKVPDYLKLMGPFMSQPSPYAHGDDQVPVLDGVFEVGRGPTGSGTGSKKPPH
ncbi:hypothetical protein SEUCBS139899_008695 [Sporothrix eucalyptigena]|uniref:C2H2-type domain-containing protein n=1 Tax=Sporothrix eucalyptigena TaxID=1812306 RepID=A0ABP0ANN7_9PEZI